MVSAGRSWRIVGAAAGAAAIGCLDANPKFVEPTAGSGDGSTGIATTEEMTTGGPTSGPPTTSSTTSPPTTGPTSDTESTTTGPPPGCGDGAIDPGEECDDGAANADDAPCTSFCALASCGDGLVLANVEECDDGAFNADDGACKTDCTAAVCGDAIVAFGLEECDDGADNADDAACTSQCTAAACGDLLVQAGVEDCDDGNLDNTDGCVQCHVPAACIDIVAAAPDPMLLKSETHMIDPDGGGPSPLIPVWCDMTTDGGGWTLIERSPRNNAIAEPLFKDVMVNVGMPESTRYRMPKMVISTILVNQPPELRIDCGGEDYLLTDPPSLFLGEIGPMDCNNFATVKYKEAQLKGMTVMDTQICTGIMGKLQGCGGAWRIEESVQAPCGLMPFPWVEMLSPDGADLFAVDAAQTDPGHDCHKPGAVREIKVR